jgi:hypothetical protein
VIGSFGSSGKVATVLDPEDLILQPARTYAEFQRNVMALLEPTAKGKGYNTTGVDGQNLLYEFVQEAVGGPGHAIGEAIYKVRRYAAKRNPEDLEKLAAWAFLMWKHHQDK